MTWSQLLLAAAILVVFLFWRRARHQVATMKADIEAHRDRNTFTFELDEDGRTFLIRATGGGQIDPAELRWNDHGLEMIDVDRRLDAGARLQPGAAIELVDMGGRIDVHDVVTDAPVADVSGAAGAALALRLDAGEIGSCMVFRRPEPYDRTIRLLLIHPAVNIER